MPVHLLVQLAHAGRALHQKRTVQLGVDLVARGRRHGGGEIAHYLFQNVVQGDQPLNVAIFVDDQANSLLVALEFGQLHVERRTFRNEVDLVHFPQQARLVELIPGYQPQSVAGVEKAHNVVDAVAIEQDLGVGAVGQLALDALPVVIDIDGVDIAAGHHDVLDQHLVEIQDAQQHLLMALGDQAARLVDYGAQLLGVEGVILVWRDLQHLEQTAGYAVDQPDQRGKRHHQPLEDPGGGVGNLLGEHGRQRLGSHFTKYQHHQGQAKSGHRDTEIAEQPDTDDGGNGGGEDIDQVVADKDEAEQPIRA